MEHVGASSSSPRNKGSSPPPPPGHSRVDEEEAEEERPTLVPDFDPHAFARDTERRQRAAAVASDEASIDQARRLHAEGQHEQALFVLGQLLDLAPLHPEATALATGCREALERECLDALGHERALLVLAVSPDELKDFALDHVSGFLLSLLDGATTVEDVLDICGLPRLLALRHLRSLVDRGIVCPASGMHGPVERR